MADVRRVRQYTHETRALRYGHFGTATYDHGSRQWNFLRQHRTRRRWAADGSDGPSPDQPSFELVDKRISSAQNAYSFKAFTTSEQAGDEKGVKALLVKHIPDAANARMDQPTSAESRRPSTPNRPPAGTLALGNARSPSIPDTGASVPTTPILAFPAGNCKEMLLLTGFEPDQVDVDSGIDLQDACTIAFVARRVMGYWVDSADPIHHVSSANSIHSNQFLVVKSTGTTILRPVLTEKLPPFLSQAAAVETFIDPGLVVTIPFSRTGRHPHAHATFNPNNQNLVAIVDASGCWSVWKLTGGGAASARILDQAHLQGSGTLGHDSRQSPLGRDASQESEWHRVCWLRSPAGAFDRIMVCNRRVAAAFGQHGQLVGQLDMRLGTPSEMNVIMDIKNSSSRPDLCFVLTTSRLMIFSSARRSRRKEDTAEPLELVCSWNHGRDRTDLGLRLSILEFSIDFWILLYSSSTYLAVMYRIGYPGLNSDGGSLQDPSIFELPPLLRDHISDIENLLLCPVEFAIEKTPPVTKSYGLVKLFACTKDGQIIEVLYKHSLEQPLRTKKQIKNKLEKPLEENTENQPVGALQGKPRGNAVGQLEDDTKELLKDLLILSLRVSSDLQARSTRHAGSAELEDFIVSDDVEPSDIVEQILAVRDTPMDLQLPSSSGRSWQRTFDFLILKDEGVDNDSLRTCLERAVTAFESLQRENETTSIHLMSDLVDRFPTMDVEMDSRDMETWLDSLTLRDDMDVQAISAGQLPPVISNQGLLNRYNHLVQLFVGSLSESATDRNRVGRERLVREIVGPTVFGALMLKIKSAFNPEASPKSMAALTSRSGSPHLSPVPESDDPGLSQMSTPEVSSQVSEEPAVIRLRHYTTFIHQVPPLLLDENTTTSAITGHLPLSMDEDPADYSYQETTRRIKLLHDKVAAESLDPRERKKALKAAARLQQKLEKTRQMTREVALQSSLLPSVGTSRGVQTREVQSSQALMPESSQITDQNGAPDLPMTQPERGAFGTRQAAKKGRKGKKRTEGF